MRLIVLFIALLFVLVGCKNQKHNNEIITNNTLDNCYADSVCSHIIEAAIPTDTFLLTDFVVEDNSKQIQNAIDHVAEKGGGTVIIPSGEYYCGPIVLKSKVNLHLEENAVIRFIPNPELYPLVYTWFSGIPCMNYSPMLYANNANDIQISGKGIIDGMGNNPIWEEMKVNERIDWGLLQKYESIGTDPLDRKFGAGHSLQPDLVAFIACSRVNISGVRFLNAPNWIIHTILSNHITIKNSLIESYGYYKVGIALESSQFVLVDSVQVQSVEDGVKLLSGRVEIPENKAAMNIVVKNSTFKNMGNSAISISSHAQAGVKKIFFSNLEIDSANYAFVAYAGRSGFKKDIFLNNIQANRICSAFFYVKSFNRPGAGHINTINLSNIDVNNCGRAFIINGFRSNPPKNITIRNSRFVSHKGSFAYNLKDFSLLNVYDNDKKYDGNYSIGKGKSPEISLNLKEKYDLDSKGFLYQSLPKKVKSKLKQDYPLAPIYNIRKMVTSTNVIYEFEFDLKSSNDLTILIEENGQLIRSEKELDFEDIPGTVMNTLEKYLSTVPNRFFINEIKKVTFQDFEYFEIEGEYKKKLFVVGIMANGKTIEEKDKSITSYFDPK